jgi:hypothetical protein
MIPDATAADRLRLVGIGPAPDGFSAVLAATTDTAQGALIDTGGVAAPCCSPAALTAGMVGFA